jgi:hypothetical protein
LVPQENVPTFLLIERASYGLETRGLTLLHPFFKQSWPLFLEHRTTMSVTRETIARTNPRRENKYLR